MSEIQAVKREVLVLKVLVVALLAAIAWREMSPPRAEAQGRAKWTKIDQLEVKKLKVVSPIATKKESVSISSSAVQLLDEKGNPLVSLTNINGMQYLIFMDAAGKARLALMSDKKNGGTMSLMDTKGKPKLKDDK